LHHDYSGAIKAIIALQKDTLYRYDDTDEQNLADAYYNAGKLDSAKNIINKLLVSEAQNNHPEVKLHLYRILGQIAEQQNDFKQAGYNFKRAMQQSEDHIARLTKVGNVSSEIKIDEMQGAYLHKEEVYQQERLWLIFMVITAVLTIVIVAVSYRSARQKRYYERILFTTRKEELAFINSHEVRRHLSNILGIVNMLKDSEDKYQDYLEVEGYLLTAAEDLDQSIKNISDKLDSHD
jgi:tetratricopeptide (TPR) repeat protein